MARTQSRKSSNGFKVIDADGHIEPAPVCDWKKYVRAPFGAMAEEMAKRGFDVNGDRTTPYRPYLADDTRKVGYLGGFDPGARLEAMDEEGIDVAVLFGGTMGLGLQASADKPGCAQAIAEGYNTWLLEEFCAKNPKRLKGAALLALEDLEHATREAERAVKLGAAGIVMRPFFHDKAIDDREFDAFYSKIEDLDVPLLVHGPGEVRAFLSTRYHTHFRRHAVDFPMSIVMATMDAICGGLFERHKKLRVAFLEGSLGWVPWWVDRLDEHFEKLPHHVPMITEKPSKLFKRYVQEGRLFVSCEPDEHYMPFVIDSLGDDFIIYASDFPHWDAIYPKSVLAIKGRKELSEESKLKILGGNAQRLFGSAV